MGASRLVSSPLLAFLIPLSLALSLPGVSSAQYMYLDANGDGVSTPADVIQPSGATAVDVWLRTDAGRNGVPAVCSAGDLPLSILGYSFVLRAANGTVSYAGFVNRVPEFTASLGEGSSETEYANGVAGGVALPPGLYRLATVSVTPTGGTPAIEIVANSTLPGGYSTAFSSECYGLDLDGSLKLGSDWTDVDGAAFGGQANTPPSIDPIGNVTVAETATATAPLRAVDPDGDPLEFSLVTGPSYATVVTVNPGAGVAEGRVDLAPGFEDAGDAAVGVRASDGFLTAEAVFSVHVENTNRAVTIGTVPDQVVREGETVLTRVFADDPDHDDISFGIVSAPDYVSVSVLVARAPAVAEIRISPGLAAAGIATVVLFATDATTRAETSFRIEVIDASNYVPPILAALEDAALAAGTVVERTLHGRSAEGEAVTFSLASGPAFASVTTSSTDPTSATGTLHLAPGPGDIGFHEVRVNASDGIRTDPQSLWITVVEAGAPVPPGPDNFDASYLAYETGSVPQALAVGDFDADGSSDVGVASLDGALTLWFGSADGRMRRRQIYALGGAPYSVAIGDVNGDGVTDLAVADSASDVVTILPGVGAGLFGGRVDLACGERTAHVSLGDLNGDGNLDVVSANEGEASISVLLGHGDFTFEPRVTYPVGEDPCYTRISDLDRDGRPDIAVANEVSNSVSILLGTGAGAFAPQVQYATARDPRSVTAGDLNGDGIPDLAVPAFAAHQASILIGRGDGTFEPHRDYLTGSCPWAITLADFNRDSRLDVATANVCSDDVAVLFGDGAGGLASPIDTPTGQATRFLRAGDFDRDGRPDLAVCDEGSSTLDILLGNGDGTFGTSTLLPIDLTRGRSTVADLNGDGSPDVAAPLYFGKIGLYFNRGDGSIASSSELPTVDLPSFILADDWTSDGIADLVVASTPAGTLWFYRGKGSGAFEDPTSIPLDGLLYSAMNARVDADEVPDLIVGQSTPNALIVLKGRGDGTFEPSATLATQGVPWELAVGDWNADGKPDIAVGEIQPSNAVGVVLADGAGGFTQGPRQPTTDIVAGLAVHDSNRDGVQDLVTTFSKPFLTPFDPFDGYLTILRPDGADGFAGTGERFVGRSPHTFVLRDVDGDARDDIAILNGVSRMVSLLPAVEGSDFGARTAFGASGAGYGLAVADWDGDGDLDLVASGQDGVAVLKNRGYRTVPTVAVRLFATEENQTLRLAGKKPSLCVQVEPVNGSFELSDLDMGTVVLRSAGTGSVEEISAIQGKGVGAGDRDRNGVSEIAACFGQESLAALFGGVRGSVEVTATLEGRLYSGERLSGPVLLRVISAPQQALAVGLSPNPMNPVGALTVVTAAPGPLHVTLHDLRGRLIEEVARHRFAPAGEYRFLLGAGSSSRLASGLYFYRVEGAGRVRTGKLTVLK